MSTNRLLSTLDSVLSSSTLDTGSTSDATEKQKEVTAKAKRIMESLVENVQEFNVNQMLNTVSKFDPGADSSRMVSKMASSLSDNIPLGGVVAASTNETKLVATKATGANLATTTLQPSPGTNISMATLPIDPTSEVSVNVIENVVNVLVSRSGRPAEASSNTLSINVRQNNKPFAVKGLGESNLIKFTMTSSKPETDECNYYDEDTGEWATKGVEKDSFDADTKSITCATEHLTSFATLPQPSTSAQTEVEAGNTHGIENVVIPTAFGVFVVVAVAVVAFVIHRRQNTQERTEEGGFGEEGREDYDEVTPVPKGHNVLVQPSLQEQQPHSDSLGNRSRANSSTSSEHNPLTRKFSTVSNAFVPTQDIAENEAIVDTEAMQQQLHASVLDQRKCSAVVTLE